MGGSKKYRGKPCAYCAQPSTAPDHVVARGFFIDSDRKDLPEVPVCDRCNTEKSSLETELMAVLPFGGKHAAAREHLSTLVARRLNKNRRVHRRLQQGQGRTWTRSEAGLHIRAMTLPVDPDKLLDLHKWITRGLMFWHWGVRLTDEHEITALALAARGEEVFDQLFSLNVAAHVITDLKNGTFVYEGAQATDDPTMSAWRYELFGGIQFGDPTRIRPESCGNCLMA